MVENTQIPELSAPVSSRSNSPTNSIVSGSIRVQPTVEFLAQHANFGHQTAPFSSDAAAPSTLPPYLNYQNLGVPNGTNKLQPDASLFTSQFSAGSQSSQCPNTMNAMPRNRVDISSHSSQLAGQCEGMYATRNVHPSSATLQPSHLDRSQGIPHGIGSNVDYPDTQEISQLGASQQQQRPPISLASMQLNNQQHDRMILFIDRMNDRSIPFQQRRREMSRMISEQHRRLLANNDAMARMNQNINILNNRINNQEAMIKSQQGLMKMRNFQIRDLHGLVSQVLAKSKALYARFVAIQQAKNEKILEYRRQLQEKTSKEVIVQSEAGCPVEVQSREHDSDSDHVQLTESLRNIALDSCLALSNIELKPTSATLSGELPKRSLEHEDTNTEEPLKKKRKMQQRSLAEPKRRSLRLSQVEQAMDEEKKNEEL